MTTGSDLRDSRVAVSTSGGTRLKGPYLGKTWTGGDYPKRTRLQKRVYSKVRKHWTRLPNGKRVWFYTQHSEYRPPVYPPKRLRHTEEHAYSMSYVRAYPDIVEYRNPYASGPQTDISLNPSGSSLGGWACMDLQPNLWTSADTLKSQKRLVNKLFGSDFDAGVFLGEGRESLKMITSAATRIYQAYYAARRGNFGYAARSLLRGTDRERAVSHLSLAKNWLELQYGWKPLLSDIDGAMKRLAHLEQPMRFSVTSRTCRCGTNGGQGGDNHTPWCGAPREYGASHIIALGSGYKSICSTSTKIILTEKAVKKLSEFAYIDPLTVAWELLPYSFILDWFIPVGDYLRVRGAARDLADCKVVSTLYQLRECAGFEKNPTSFLTYVRGPGLAQGTKRVSVVRTISTGLDVPLPRFKPLEDVPSWKRAANAVSLLAVGRDRYNRGFVTFNGQARG